MKMISKFLEDIQQVEITWTSLKGVRTMYDCL